MVSTIIQAIVNGLFGFIIQYIGILQAKDVEVKADDPKPTQFVNPDRVFGDLGLRSESETSK